MKIMKNFSKNLEISRTVYALVGVHTLAHHTEVRENRALSEFPQNLALDLRDKLTSWIKAADLGPEHLQRAREG